MGGEGRVFGHCRRSEYLLLGQQRVTTRRSISTKPAGQMDSYSLLSGCKVIAPGERIGGDGFP
jgi:hypothetical protein